jgi:DNA-binding FadR family transcriptional regulator
MRSSTRCELCAHTCNEEVGTISFNHELDEPAYRPQYERIAELIVEYIATHELHPGDRLPTEQQLSEEFGVSRMTVRDAVKVLTPSGAVRTRRGSGIFVGEEMQWAANSTMRLTPVPPERINELFAFRSFQEMHTARLAAENVTVAELRTLEQAFEANRVAARQGNWDTFLASDDSFHRTIALASHNFYFADLISSVLHLQRWAVRLVTGGAPGSLLRSVEQHALIFEAIRDGDPQRAAEAARAHVETVLAAYQAEARRRLVN